MKSFFKLITGLLMALIMTPAVQSVAAEYNVQLTALDATGITVGTGVVLGGINHLANFQGNGLAFAGLNQEIWVPGIIDAFRVFGSWIDKITSYDQYIANETINLSYIGADPAVIWNPTFPLTEASRTDSNLALGLEYVTTNPTKVTETEILNLAYDKNASVLVQHQDALKRDLEKYTLHSLAPASNSVANKRFVNETTGTLANNRKPMKFDDIATLANQFDTAEVPKDGRILVLAPEHQLDLQKEDRATYNQLFNHAAGSTPPMLYGFEVHLDTIPVVYDGSNAKKAWGAAAAPLTDRNASVAFTTKRSWRAKSTPKLFYDPSTSNPLTQTTMMSLACLYGSGATKAEGFGAIVTFRS